MWTKFIIAFVAITIMSLIILWWDLPANPPDELRVLYKAASSRSSRIPNDLEYYDDNSYTYFIENESVFAGKKIYIVHISYIDHRLITDGKIERAYLNKDEKTLIQLMKGAVIKAEILKINQWEFNLSFPFLKNTIIKW